MEEAITEEETDLQALIDNNPEIIETTTLITETLVDINGQMIVDTEVQFDDCG